MKDDHIKLLTLNTFYSMRFDKVAKLVEKKENDIYCFQEITKSKKDKLTKEVFDGNFFVSRKYIPSDFARKNHNVTLSKYEFIDAGEIYYDKKANKIEVHDTKHAYSIVLFSDLMIHGRKVRIYNCHLQVKRIGINQRFSIIKEVLEHAQKFDGYVIITGDMNTIVPQNSKRRKLMKLFQRYPEISNFIDGKYVEISEKYVILDLVKSMGYKSVLDIDEVTWKIPFFNIGLFKFQLDWVIYRGFTKTEYRFDKYPGDHKPINVKLFF